MSMKMEDGIKRRTAERKSALVLDIIQGKTAAAEASRAYDPSPSEVEQWVDDAKEQYEPLWKDQQEAYGEAMPELGSRKNLHALLYKEEKRSFVSSRA